MALANLFQPGTALATSAAVESIATIESKVPSLREFVLHIFPNSAFDAMAKNDVLQILVFSVFAGVGLSALGERGRLLVQAAEQLADLMLQVTHYVMRFAPFAVLGALAAVVTTRGIGILATFGKLAGQFYLGLAVLWAILIAIGFIFLRRRIFTLLRYVREPFLIAFSTASSEAALPKLFEQLDRFGVPRRLSGFILPLGYSFNLDGSMMYMSFATLFVAQAYHIDLSLQTQVVMLLTLMVTSKGIAAVLRLVGGKDPAIFQQWKQKVWIDFDLGKCTNRLQKHLPTVSIGRCSERPVDNLGANWFRETKYACDRTFQ